MARMICGGSVQGARHKLYDMPCQDRYRIVDKSEDVTVLSVADGHGDKACPYSGTGARIAARLFCSTMKVLLEAYKGKTEKLMHMLDHENRRRVIARLIETKWKDNVRAYHLKSGRKMPVNGNGKYDPDALYKMYGTTLLGLCVTPEFMFAFQIGDGDIVHVDGVHAESIIEADKLLGTETHSLSSKEAWRHAKSVMRRLDTANIANRDITIDANRDTCRDTCRDTTRDTTGDTTRDISTNNNMHSDCMAGSVAGRMAGTETEPAPELYWMSTDGFANSYASTGRFMDACRGYYDYIQDYGFETLRYNLEEYLNETSRDESGLGSGDDITVVMLYFGPEEPVEELDDPEDTDESAGKGADKESAEKDSAGKESAEKDSTKESIEKESTEHDIQAESIEEADGHPSSEEGDAAGGVDAESSADLPADAPAADTAVHTCVHETGTDSADAEDGAQCVPVIRVFDTAVDTAAGETVQNMTALPGPAEGAQHAAVLAAETCVPETKAAETFAPATAEAAGTAAAETADKSCEA